MEIGAALAEWRREAGLCLLLGDPELLEQAAERLGEQGCAVASLTDELLARCPERDALIAAERALAPGVGRIDDHQLAWQAHRTTVRRRLTEAFAAWLAEAAASADPLAVREIELAAGERLPLERLAELPRPVLLLLTGRRTEDGAVLLGDEGPAVRLPPALTRGGVLAPTAP